MRPKPRIIVIHVPGSGTGGGGGGGGGGGWWRSGRRRWRWRRRSGRRRTRRRRRSWRRRACSAARDHDPARRRRDDDDARREARRRGLLDDQRRSGEACGKQRSGRSEDIDQAAGQWRARKRRALPLGKHAVMLALGLGELALHALAGRTLAHQLEKALGALHRCAGDVGTGEAGEGQRRGQRGRDRSAGDQERATPPPQPAARRPVLAISAAHSLFCPFLNSAHRTANLPLPIRLRPH